MLYREYLVWTGFELTTLMVIGTDCIGSYKSNYYTIMTTTRQGNVFSYLIHFHRQKCFLLDIFTTHTYLDITRSCKCPKCSPMVCLNCNYLQSVRYFVSVLRESIFFLVHVLISFDHKLYQIWNNCILPVMYWSITQLNKLLLFFLKEILLPRAICIFIIYHSIAVITASGWLDGRFQTLGRP